MACIWGEITRSNAAGRFILKTKRKVIIQSVGDSWAVAYVERRKFQRYWAAVFYKKIKTREQVIAWISEQANIEL